jgi:hypothetical protein
MAGRSGILAFSLILGAMFSMLYLGGTLAQPRYTHVSVPTEPRISQVEALEIVENHLQSRVPELEETRLLFMWYNFSQQRYQSDPEYNEYIKSLGPFPWTLDHVREKLRIAPDPVEVCARQRDGVRRGSVSQYVYQDMRADFA